MRAIRGGGLACAECVPEPGQLLGRLRTRLRVGISAGMDSPVIRSAVPPGFDPDFLSGPAEEAGRDPIFCRQAGTQRNRADRELAACTGLRLLVQDPIELGPEVALELLEELRERRDRGNQVAGLVAILLPVLTLQIEILLER